MKRTNKMKIFLLLSILLLTIFFVLKKVFYSAKRNLFKDQAAWSSKDIKINYSKSKDTTELKKNHNYLKIIADESKLYLENEYREVEE